jgi:hypothetical protein
VKGHPRIPLDPRHEPFALERSLFERPLTEGHGDFTDVDRIVAALLRQAGAWETFAKNTALLIRRAIDEVIDTARTNRFRLADTEKTEKTYLGTKIEILFRSSLNITKGSTLDLSIEGTEVDVKNTIGINWAIPQEALGHPCVLIRESETTARCSVGVIIARENYLNRGRNRDGKRTFSVAGLRNVWWILEDFPYPQNFWEVISPVDREKIMSARGGTDRLSFLFEMLQDRPIPRSVVEHVAQQKDAMKRVRRNGGARDVLARKGIVVLYGQKDRATIAALGIPEIDEDHFISHRPRSECGINLLRMEGHLD